MNGRPVHQRTPLKRTAIVALKSEFDNKSFWIVVTRSLTGALMGAIPGTIYIFNTEQNLATNPFGMVLIQTGSIVGALILGLAALAGTVVASLKNRNTAISKSHRIKEYLNPDTLPAIPPASKPTSKAPSTETSLPAESKPPEAADKELAALPVVQPEQPVFEDYDR